LNFFFFNFLSYHQLQHLITWGNIMGKRFIRRRRRNLLLKQRLDLHVQKYA